MLKRRLKIFPPSSSSNEANNAIKERLEKNGSPQEEVRKLKREKEIQSIRLCEILEQIYQAQEDLESRNHEQQNQSNQNEDLIDQISKENEEIRILKAQNERIRNDLNYEREINERILRELRSEKQINEKLKNDLNDEKQINERMIKFQQDVNQLNQKNEQNIHRKKGKVGLGYNEKEGESSKQGAKRNQKPTCNKCWSNRKEKFNGRCYK